MILILLSDCYSVFTVRNFIYLFSLLCSLLFSSLPSFLSVCDICLCVHMMLLSGVVVESAHWPLTVDVVAMVKVACSRHPVPLLPLLCNSTPFFFFHLSVITQGNVTPPSHYLLTYCQTVCTNDSTRNLLTASTEERVLLSSPVLFTYSLNRMCETDFQASSISCFC